MARTRTSARTDTAPETTADSVPASGRGATARPARADRVEDTPPAKKKRTADPAATDKSARQPQRRRRSADPGQRRNPERTRQVILEAATEEFAAVGYDGARVMRIAERAGVAHQLITYHFGGKRGLFEALSEQFVAHSRSVVEGEETFVEILAALVQQAGESSDFGRVLLRESQQGIDHADLTERFAPLVDNARERQARGEIPADIDPGIFTLVFFAANLAPSGMPHITRALSAVDPADPDFSRYYSEQLVRLVGHLTASARAQS